MPFFRLKKLGTQSKFPRLYVALNMNSSLGILMIVACAILCWSSVNYARKGNYTLALAFLVLIGLILRFHVGSDLFLHAWDERYHALVAKNMMNHPLVPTLYDNPLLPYDFKTWSGNHIWLHKQPLPLWGIMTSLSIFGTNEIAVRIPSIILSLLGILTCYHIGKRLFSREVGYISAFLFSINGLIIELTSGRIATDHIDVFFLFFIQLAVLFAIRFTENKNVWWNILCGISIGLAILSKWLPALIVVPIWLGLILHSKKFSFKELFFHGTLLLITVLLIALPWQFYIHAYFPIEANWEASFNRRHLTEVIEEQSRPLFYHFTTMRIAFGEIVYLPLIWFLLKSIKKRWNWKYWSLVCWILIPYLFFTVAATKMLAYPLFTSPAIFIITALYIVFLKRNLPRFRYKWIPITGIILLIGLPIRFSLERVKPLQTIDRSPKWRNDLVELSAQLKDPEKCVVFNVQQSIELMFYSDAVAYDFIPSNEQIESLMKKGYNVYVNDCGNKLVHLPLVNYISLTPRN